MNELEQLKQQLRQDFSAHITYAVLVSSGVASLVTLILIKFIFKG